MQVPVFQPDPLRDTDASAAYINSTRRHVQRLCQDGRIPYFVIARRIQIRQSDLDAYLKHARRPAVVGPLAETR